MWTTYWWEIIGEESALYGEEFFTELKSNKKSTHFKYAKENFPKEKLRCLGKVSTTETKMSGIKFLK